MDWINMLKKLIIRDLDVKEIVSSYADGFSGKVVEQNNEYLLALPDKIGSGFIKGTHFSSGVGVIECDFTLNNDLTIQVESGMIHPLKIIFNRESSFTHQFSGAEEKHEIRRLENVIVAGTAKNENIFFITGGSQVCIYSIQINRKLFEEKIENFLKGTHQDLIALFRDVNGVNEFFYKEHYSLDIAKYIREFTECEQSGFMRSVYLEGKTYEILTHQIQQYLDDLKEPEKRKILRQSTIENIEKAARIIREEIESMDSILQLAKRVGLNQNILQNGFQQLYKTSVKEYISNFRIEKAKELMETTDLNITEITYRIGISSRSYFSKIFKTRYGVLPSEYKKQTRAKSHGVSTG